MTSKLIKEEEFKIDPWLRDYLPGTSDTETGLLEEQLIETNGPDHPLVVWDEEDLLVDGHRRFGICKKHGLPYQVVRKSFKDRDEVVNWMLVTQISRRNVMDHDRAVLTSRYYRHCQELKGDDVGGSVVETVSNATGQSARTIHRANEYARAFESLHDGWKETIKGRIIRCPQKYVLPLAKLNFAQQERLLEEVLEAGDIGPMKEAFGKGKRPAASVHKPTGERFLAPTPEQKERELHSEPTLPDDVPSAMPEARVDPEKKRPKKKTADEIRAMVTECEKLSGPFARHLDKLFSEDGLGLEARSSGRKRRIDQALRTIGVALHEVQNEL
jgi:hypothetical protein